MKRLVLIAVLLLGGAINAYADNDVYNNALKQPRGDDACTPTPRCAMRNSARRRMACRRRGPTRVACALMAGASAIRSARAGSATIVTPTPTIPD
jgi:hypothetical protein